jgi:cyclic beta-1,2-glucan synthetase
LERAARQAAAIAASLVNEGEQLKRWSQALQENCEDHLADLRFFAPWLALPNPSPDTRNGEVIIPASPVESGQDGPSPAPATLQQKLTQLDQAPTLREVATLDQSLCPLIEAALQNLPTEPPNPAGKSKNSSRNSRAACVKPATMPASGCSRWKSLARQSDELAAMDFAFCSTRRGICFPPGSTSAERRCDNSFYDLLASEARLCSYVAIALGQVPQKHWFSMGRLLVASRGEPILVSWSGSMFEYLMPLLVMPNYENTLLDHTCKAAVQQQIEYGKLRGVPWGISESGYNRTTFT